MVVMSGTFQACSRAPVPLKLDAIISGFDGQFDAAVGTTLPGAVILLIKDGEVYYQGAFGYKDLENKQRMTIDTVFRVASISKTIAALRAMRLVEAGLIALDDTVDNYLSRERFPASIHDIQGITFRKLLSHTIGTRAHFYYSDIAYNILQLEMRLITRSFLADYVTTHIFEPLTMSSSFYESGPLPIPDERLARPHTSDLGSPPFVFLSEAWNAAGGLYTTAGDLANLIIAIMNCYNGDDTNFIVTRDTLVTMVRPQGRGLMVSGLFTGLGFFVTEHENGKMTVSHGGILPGWRAHYEFSLETGDGIIILTNGDSGGELLIQPVMKQWLHYVKSR